jgi:broad specificity phosphatase PhoE
MLYLVRHGRPAFSDDLPAHEWPLDPAYADDVLALRPRLPRKAVWFSSPEPKAIGTARLLTDEPIRLADGLREHERRTTDWIDDFGATVRRAFEHPDEPAYDGWEPLADTRRRVVSTASTILTDHPDDDVVLVGHGTAWTLLRAAVLGEEPDLAWWSALAMPDVVPCEVRTDPDDMLAP